MVGNFVSSNKPIGHKGVISVVEGCEVGHLGLAAVRILALSEELVDGIDGVGLDCVVSGEDDELGDVFLSFHA